MRKAFNFYKSYYDVMLELPEKDRLAFIVAILEKEFHGVEPDHLKGVLRLAYISQKHSIDAQVKGYEDKTGTKLTPCQPPSVPPKAQEKEKEEGKVQVKEKEVYGIEERKLKFASTLEPFSETYGNDMITEFYNYWTEPNKSNTKYRQELEKTWALGARLKRWSDNNNKFNKKPNNEKLTEFTSKFRGQGF